MKKAYLTISVIVLLGAALFAYDVLNKQAQAPKATESLQQISKDTVSGLPNSRSTAAAPESVASSTPKTQAELPTKATSHFSDESDVEGNDIQVFEVVYNGNAFVPARLDIKRNDIVVFKNQSKTDFWPASNPHPTHTLYPEFDAKQALSSGKIFQFKFSKAGDWGYHNHLTPSVTGLIHVTK